MTKTLEELRIEEAENKQIRISNALQGDSSGFSENTRRRIAEVLYNIKIEHPQSDELTKDFILDCFCEALFRGCNYDEVFQAWDNFLG